uniref:Transposase n=1 Tax=Ascaris lumbricoides TaxID=6252 RepID=A0A0M3ITA7_ASCLU
MISGYVPPLPLQVEKQPQPRTQPVEEDTAEAPAKPATQVEVLDSPDDIDYLVDR